MIIQDRFVIPAPIEQTWAFLLDIPRVSACVPGAQGIEQVGDGSYQGNLLVKVGPVAANFGGKVSLDEQNPPTHLAASARAKDQNTASMVSVNFSADLAEVAADQTEVAFEIALTVRGRLGQFGQGVILETSRQMTRAFAECVQAQLAAPAAAEAAGRGEASAAPTPAVTPSILTILIRSIWTNIINWLRGLRPRYGKTSE